MLSIISKPYLDFGKLTSAKNLCILTNRTNSELKKDQPFT